MMRGVLGPPEKVPRLGTPLPTGDITTSIPTPIKNQEAASDSKPRGRQGGDAPSSVSAPIYSQQVNWWQVHSFVAPLLAAVDSWPSPGSVPWCELSDDDPVKWAALLDAAQHWALRLETCQQARCDASREVSDAVDWSAVAREINQRTDFYAARPWLKRRVS
jgi:Protein of unknown function (DUF2742)